MKRYFSFLIVAVMLAAIFAGCGTGGAGGTSGQKTIRIGVVMPMTGPVAIAGEYTKMGLDLMLQEVEDAGGIDVGGEKYMVEFLYEDNESKPEITVNAFNKLIGQDKVIAIIGTDASGTTIAAASVAQQAKVPVVATTASNPKVTEQGDFIFRACFIDDFQGYVCARLVYEDLGIQKTGILYSNADEYSTGLMQSFSKTYLELGGEAVVEAYAGADVKDFSAQLTSIKAAEVGTIFLPSMVGELALQAIQINDMGIDAQLIGQMAWDTPVLPELAGPENIEGSLFVANFAVDNPDPKAQEFIQKFEALHGVPPNGSATTAYEAYSVIIEGIRRAGELDGQKIRDEMAQIRDLELATGIFTFDENRNPQKSAFIMEYVNGVPRFHSVINP